MTRDEAVVMIRGSAGRILRVTFTKRSTGEPRVMVCRLGVTAYLVGGAPAYDFAAKGLICVFDMQKQAYRTVAIEGITGVAFAGQEFAVAD